MNKFEKLIDYILNEDEANAKALFHKIVVEKSRDIYESLVDEEQGPVRSGQGSQIGQQITDHQDEIEGDEIGEAEDDLGGDEFGGDEADLGGDADAELGGEGEVDIETRVMDLEDALDELKAEFDALMSDEEAEEENFPGIHDNGEEGGEEDFGGEEVGAGEDDIDSDEDDEEKIGEASVYGEAKDAKKGLKQAPKKTDKKNVDKDVKEGKSPADLMREYVEKVGQDWGKQFPAEGDPIGSGGSKSPVNTKSVQINGKNDMGGTTANIARGGSEEAMPSGPKKPSNAYSKGEKKMGQDSYENSPGANTKGYKDKRTARTKEGSESAAKGSVSVNDKSLEPGGKPGFKG